MWKSLGEGEGGEGGEGEGEREERGKRAGEGERKGVRERDEGRGRREGGIRGGASGLKGSPIMITYAIYNTQHSACFTTTSKQRRLYIPDLASKDVVA